MKKNLKSIIFIAFTSISIIMIFVFGCINQGEKNKHIEIKVDEITPIENDDKLKQEKVDELVEKSKYNVIILPTPNCENNICKIGFKNPKNNLYKAKLKLRYQNDYIYESDFLSPSYQLSSITLNKKMKKGKYPVLGIITIDVDGVLSNINVEMYLDIK